MRGQVEAGMKNIPGFKQSTDGPTEGSQNRANKLKQFLYRFDYLLSLQFGPHHTPTTNDPSSHSPQNYSTSFKTSQVKRELEKLHKGDAIMYVWDG